MCVFVAASLRRGGGRVIAGIYIVHVVFSLSEISKELHFFSSWSQYLILFGRFLLIFFF